MSREITKQVAPTMPPATRKALKASIAHWKRLVEDRRSEEIGSGSCALCRRFLDKPDPCQGCPVREKTHQRFCKGTPYVQAQALYQDGGDAEWDKAARAELAFLESLLPPAKRQPRKRGAS